jgi:hypothetical protein
MIGIPFFPLAKPNRFGRRSSFSFLVLCLLLIGSVCCSQEGASTEEHVHQANGAIPSLDSRWWKNEEEVSAVQALLDVELAAVRKESLIAFGRLTGEGKPIAVLRRRLQMESPDPGGMTDWSVQDVDSLTDGEITAVGDFVEVIRGKYLEFSLEQLERFVSRYPLDTSIAHLQAPYTLLLSQGHDAMEILGNPAKVRLIKPIYWKFIESASVIEAELRLRIDAVARAATMVGVDQSNFEMREWVKAFPLLSEGVDAHSLNAEAFFSNLAGALHEE